ncbi:MAG: endopeptidase La, partial [Bacteroidetes bacterium SW_10_40_5]
MSEDNPEFISLLSPEEEEEMNNEDVPDQVPILPLRNTVLYPGVVIPITVGRDKSIQLINDARQEDSVIGVTAQKSTDVEDPDAKDLYQTGTLAKILKHLKMPDGNVTVIIQGKKRFSIQEITNTDPYFKASIQPFDEKPIEIDDEQRAMMSTMKDMATTIVNLSPNIPSEATTA